MPHLEAVFRLSSQYRQVEDKKTFINSQLIKHLSPSREHFIEKLLPLIDNWAWTWENFLYCYFIRRKSFFGFIIKSCLFRFCFYCVDFIRRNAFAMALWLGYHGSDDKTTRFVVFNVKALKLVKLYLMLGSKKSQKFMFNWALSVCYLISDYFSGNCRFKKKIFVKIFMIW